MNAKGQTWNENIRTVTSVADTMLRRLETPKARVESTTLGVTAREFPQSTR